MMPCRAIVDRGKKGINFHQKILKKLENFSVSKVEKDQLLEMFSVLTLET